MGLLWPFRLQGGPHACSYLGDDGYHIEPYKERSRLCKFQKVRTEGWQVEAGRILTGWGCSRCPIHAQGVDNWVWYLFEALAEQLSLSPSLVHLPDATDRIATGTSQKPSVAPPHCPYQNMLFSTAHVVFNFTVFQLYHHSLDDLEPAIHLLRATVFSSIGWKPLSLQGLCSFHLHGSFNTYNVCVYPPLLPAFLAVTYYSLRDSEMGFRDTSLNHIPSWWVGIQIGCTCINNKFHSFLRPFPYLRGLLLNFT